jgi:hypothetical protein
MSSKQFKHAAHRFFAGFMAIWLSGAVFLLCCERMNAAPDDAEFCPLAKMSAHCDKGRKADPFRPRISTGLESADCCAFLPAIFDKTRKVEQVQKQIAAAPAVLAAPGFRLATKVTAPTFTSFSPRIEAHQKLFIQNCAFRI